MIFCRGAVGLHPLSCKALADGAVVRRAVVDVAVPRGLVDSATALLVKASVARDAVALDACGADSFDVWRLCRLPALRQPNQLLLIVACGVDLEG